MKNTHIKMIAQRTAEGKTILVGVIPDDFIGDNLPDIIEVQAILPPKTIYNGTAPTIKILPGSIKDRTEDLRGTGIAGIITQEMWYIHEENSFDPFGIEL